MLALVGLVPTYVMIDCAKQLNTFDLTGFSISCYSNTLLSICFVHFLFNLIFYFIIIIYLCQYPRQYNCDEESNGIFSLISLSSLMVAVSTDPARDTEAVNVIYWKSINLSFTFATCNTKSLFWQAQ